MRAPEFWNHRGPTASLLAPLGALYGASVALKARIASPYRCDARVLCVGNLTAGGAGKTPVAIAIAQSLKIRGARPFFLTRGYGGSERGPVLVSERHTAAITGDEALLLARTAPTVVARERAVGAAFATARGADVIVMDDGHQNFSLAKDMSLVVVDGETGFGNGLIMPAGPLRESVMQGLSRADAVAVMGEGDLDLKGFSGPVLRARLVVQDPHFSGKPAFAFAGIGRPEKFFASLEACGANITGTKIFADHHPYKDAEILDLRRRAKNALLVTTEKDWVRLSPELRTGITPLKVTAQFDDPAALARLLDRLTT